ncbi:hypothetical protein GCM10027417_18720 [Glutamicibacter endophyticus]
MKADTHPQVFAHAPEPNSAARRRFRALARSAPWLSDSLHVELEVPEQLGLPERGLVGHLQVLLREREAITVRAGNEIVFQHELFTVDRGRDYVAATASSWALPASLTSPVYTDDHLVARRPAIADYGDLLPLSYWASVLDPWELAGSQEAELDLPFNHPTFIHELTPVRTESDRPAVAAVLSAGYSYRPALAEFPLVPPGTRTLIVLDQATGICLERKILTGPAAPELRARVLASNEYYIDSLFTGEAPTLTDVRSFEPYELRMDVSPPQGRRASGSPGQQ